MIQTKQPKATHNSLFRQTLQVKSCSCHRCSWKTGCWSTNAPRFQKYLKKEFLKYEIFFGISKIEWCKFGMDISGWACPECDHPLEPPPLLKRVQKERSLVEGIAVFLAVTPSVAVLHGLLTFADKSIWQQDFPNPLRCPHYLLWAPCWSRLPFIWHVDIHSCWFCLHCDSLAAAFCQHYHWATECLSGQ